MQNKDAAPIQSAELAGFDAAWPEIHNAGIADGWRGAALAAWKAALAAAPATTAQEQVQPFGYISKAEAEKLADKRLAGLGMMVSKDPAEHRMPIYLAPPVAPAIPAQPIADVSAPTDERAAFEAWYVAELGGDVANMTLRQNGEYHKVQQEIAWRSYKQGAARAAAPVSGQGASLPPLPEHDGRFNINGPDGHRIKGWDEDSMCDYGRLCIDSLPRSGQAAQEQAAIPAPFDLPWQGMMLTLADHIENHHGFPPVRWANMGIVLVKAAREMLESALAAPAIQAQPLTDAARDVLAERPAYGTAPIRCGKLKCKWRGYEGELVSVPHKRIKGLGLTAKVCPTCGCDSYYIMTPKEIAAWRRSTAATITKDSNE